MGGVALSLFRIGCADPTDARLRRAFCAYLEREEAGVSQVSGAVLDHDARSVSGPYMADIPEPPRPVAEALDAMAQPVRDTLHHLRGLIFDVAATIPAVGAVTETLKWGQPSFAVQTGTPVRLGVSKSGVPALLVHCQTTVVSDARAFLGTDLSFEGNRAVLVPMDGPFPDAALRQVIHAALTYRLNA